MLRGTGYRIAWNSIGKKKAVYYSIRARDARSLLLCLHLQVSRRSPLNAADLVRYEG